MENIILKENGIYSLGETITVATPEMRELSRNGGDYFYYETPILKNGVQVGTLLETSAVFDYCQIFGNFTETVRRYCPEIDRCIDLGMLEIKQEEDHEDGFSIEHILKKQSRF